MSEFPLYESLIFNLPKKDLTLKEKKDFISKVESLDLQGSEEFYAIIREYQIRTTENKVDSSLPFKGEHKANDVVFNLLKFPIQLRQILYRYLMEKIIP